MHNTLNGGLMKYLISLLILILFILPTIAQTADCPDLLTPRLRAGDTGRVTLTGGANNMRSNPDTTAVLLTQIPEGGVFDVIAGPTCSSGYYWYQVQFGNMVGWTAESGSDRYWIEPIAVDTVTFSPEDELSLDAVNRVPTIGGRARVTGLELLEVNQIDVRDIPDVQGTVLTSLAEGTVVTLTGDSQTYLDQIWWGVSTEVGIGWMPAWMYIPDRELWLQTLQPACPHTEQRIGFHTYTMLGVGSFTSDLIYTSDYEGATLCRLYTAPDPHDAIYNLTWSHDGEWLAFILERGARSFVFSQGGSNTKGRMGRSEERTKQLYVVSADGLTLQSVTPIVSHISMIRWSSTNRLAYHRGADLDANSPSQIWHSGVNGVGEFKVTEGDVRRGILHWSADGQHLYFLRWWDASLLAEQQFSNRIESIAIADYERSVVFQPPDANFTIDQFMVRGDGSLLMRYLVAPIHEYTLFDGQTTTLFTEGNTPMYPARDSSGVFMLRDDGQTRELILYDNGQFSTVWSMPEANSFEGYPVSLDGNHVIFTSPIDGAIRQLNVINLTTQEAYVIPTQNQWTTVGFQP